MPRLYDLDTDLALLEDMLLEAGGEITPELEDDLDALLDAREDKIENYIKIIRGLESSARATKDEAKRLTDNARVQQNAVDQLKARLQASMQARGETKHKTALGTVSLRKKPPKVKVLVEVDELPDEYVRVADPQPDKRALSDALKAGTLPDGLAGWHEAEHTLSIR